MSYTLDDYLGELADDGDEEAKFYIHAANCHDELAE